MDLRELEQRHFNWRVANFPKQEAVDGLLGAVEEVGELSHAFLKAKQGIRGYDDPAKARAEISDAVGDIIIFLTGFCSLYGLSIAECVQTAWDEVEQRDWQAHPESGVTDGA